MTGVQTCALPISSLSAASACAASVLFEGFIGTTTPSDSSPPCALALRPWPFPAGLAFVGPVGDEVSRFSCMQFLSVSGVSDYGGSRGGLALCPCSFRLPFLSTRSASPLHLTKLNTLPTDPSCLRFGLPSRFGRKARGQVGRYSFPVGLFHSLLHAGLSRRSDGLLRPRLTESPPQPTPAVDGVVRPTTDCPPSCPPSCPP